MPVQHLTDRSLFAAGIGASAAGYRVIDPRHFGATTRNVVQLVPAEERNKRHHNQIGMDTGWASHWPSLPSTTDPDGEGVYVTEVP